LTAHTTLKVTFASISLVGVAAETERTKFVENSIMDEINLESSILGFCSLHGDIVFVRNHGVLIRNDDDFRQRPDRVALISGGGAGHEPGQQGFVGRGMLSVAVSGNVFTSPSVTRFDNNPTAFATIQLSGSNFPFTSLLVAWQRFSSLALVMSIGRFFLLSTTTPAID
jgi:hypothetical protein